PPELAFGRGRTGRPPHRPGLQPRSRQEPLRSQRSRKGHPRSVRPPRIPGPMAHLRRPDPGHLRGRTLRPENRQTTQQGPNDRLEALPAWTAPPPRTRSRFRRRAALQAQGGHMTTIEPGYYPIYHSVTWWNQVNDLVRRREVADALHLPADAVEIVTDSDEEVDLAS